MHLPPPLLKRLFLGRLRATPVRAARGGGGDAPRRFLATLTDRRCGKTEHRRDLRGATAKAKTGTTGVKVDIDVMGGGGATQ